jgi:uncharacterized protein YlxW (UPF0749 family)
VINSTKKAMNRLKQEIKQMTENPKKSDDKNEIVAQIADLSQLLGMIPSDDTVTINPATK